MQTDELTCNICYEHYGRSKNIPKVLTCGHTFCCKCLDAVLRTNKKCGTCRNDIRYNSTQEIPVNYVAKSMANREVQSCDAKIEFCTEHDRCPKNWNCIDCKQMICGSCAMMHHKDCQTEYVVVEKRRQLLTNVDRTKKFLTNCSKSLQTNLIELNTKSIELNKQLKKIQKDICKNEKEQQNIEHFQNKLQTVESDSAEGILPFDSAQSLLLETQSMINKLKISKLKLEETDLSFYAQMRIASFKQQNLSNSPTVNYDNIIRILENGERVHAVEIAEDNESRFGRLEYKNGTLRIHSFNIKAPAQPCSTIPFRQLLSSLTGSSELPGKVFFQIQGFEEELIVKTDEALAGSPRVLNFLYLTSGLKGPSYENKTLCRYGGLYVYISCPWMKNGEEVDDAVVDGITDGGIYEAPMKKGFVCGDDASSGYFSGVTFCLKDWEGGRFEGKFGKIVSGIRVLNQINFGGKLVQNCGFVIG